jgi:hypothetical protein
MRHRVQQIFDRQICHFQDTAERATPYLAMIGHDNGRSAFSQLNMAAALSNLFEAEPL